MSQTNARNSVCGIVWWWCFWEQRNTRRNRREKKKNSFANSKIVLDAYRFFCTVRLMHYENQSKTHENRPDVENCSNKKAHMRIWLGHGLPLDSETARQHATFFFFFLNDSYARDAMYLHGQPCVLFHQNVKVNPNFIFHNISRISTSLAVSKKEHLRWNSSDFFFFFVFWASGVLKACSERIRRWNLHTRPTPS